MPRMVSASSEVGLFTMKSTGDPRRRTSAIAAKPGRPVVTAISGSETKPFLSCSRLSTPAQATSSEATPPKATKIIVRGAEGSVGGTAGEMIRPSV